MAYQSDLGTDPLIIDDSNASRFVQRWRDEGRAFGVVPRDYHAAPFGSASFPAVDLSMGPILERSQFADAIKRADEDDDPIRWCILTEGPLDGARVGPGGLTIMGKSLSRDNAAKVASNFHLVITAFDNDKSGKEATSKISASIHGSKSRDSIISSVAAMPCARAMSPPGCQRTKKDRVCRLPLPRGRAGSS